MNFLTKMKLGLRTILALGCMVLMASGIQAMHSVHSVPKEHAASERGLGFGADQQPGKFIRGTGSAIAGAASAAYQYVPNYPSSLPTRESISKRIPSKSDIVLKAVGGARYAGKNKRKVALGAAALGATAYEYSRGGQDFNNGWDATKGTRTRMQDGYQTYTPEMIKENPGYAAAAGAAGVTLASAAAYKLNKMRVARNAQQAASMPTLENLVNALEGMHEDEISLGHLEDENSIDILASNIETINSYIDFFQRVRSEILNQENNVDQNNEYVKNALQIIDQLVPRKAEFEQTQSPGFLSRAKTGIRGLASRFDPRDSKLDPRKWNLKFWNRKSTSGAPLGGLHELGGGPAAGAGTGDANLDTRTP